MKFGRDRTPVTPEIAQAQQSARTRRRIIGSVVVLALLVIGYFVGAGTHPGAGIPGVVGSAKATAGLIV